MAAGLPAAHCTYMRVLVVDDFEPVRTSLASSLHARGFAVETAANGAEALKLLEHLQFDLMVLDLMMPGTDGMQVLRTLRSRETKPRVLVLSARDHVEDRVEALNLGADDYLVKPFAFDELLARLMALSRRSASEASPELSHGRLRLDTARQIARVDDLVLQLTAKEYALLELLMRRKGHVMNRATIFSHLYETESSASERVIEVLMSTLRQKLAIAGIENLVETRRGFGYVLE